MVHSPQTAKNDSSRILTSAFEKLSAAKELRTITFVVAEAARLLSGADGTTFVLRDGDLCYYIDESAISPLWKGQRFPMTACISGWSMIHQEAVLIPDIYKDNRIPHDAYRPTFVNSLCMIPIRIENPLGAIGSYWSNPYTPTADEVKSLQILANSTAIAIENLELRTVLSRQSSKSEGLVSRNSELEIAINSIAHDLRTPLAGMTGMAELLRYYLNDKVDQKHLDYIQAIISTGRQASLQIEQMLQLYRATTGSIAKQELNLTKVAQQLIHTLQPELQNRIVDFSVEQYLAAYADPPLIRIVLGNLLSNAIKYSSKKEKVEIKIGSCREDESSTTFFVRDNGDGFDPELASRLFQPYQRLHSYSDFSGNGLGLVSVAKIVEVHGGRCHAEGRPQEGATFYFSLPKSVSGSHEKDVG